MYFWRVGRLKSDLVAGRVGEPETFRYILACLAALALSYLAGVLWPPEIRDRWTLVADVAASLTVVPGTMLAYAANGGARGRHFPARYFSLAWVLTIRCIALTLPAVVVVYGAAVALTGTEQPERALSWAQRRPGLQHRDPVLLAPLPSHQGGGRVLARPASPPGRRGPADSERMTARPLAMPLRIMPASW